MMRRGTWCAACGAFTLIETLIVVALIAILAGFVAVIVPGFMERAHMATSLGNLRKIGVAVQSYAADNHMELPRWETGGADRWPLALMEYLDGNTAVYADPGDPQNFLRTGNDPLDNGRNRTSYILNGFNDMGAYEDSSVGVRLTAVEQPSNTLLMALQFGSGHFYMDFVQGNQEDAMERRVYGDGSTYLFADGSARFLREEDYDDALWLVRKSSEVPPKTE